MVWWIIYSIKTNNLCNLSYTADFGQWKQYYFCDYDSVLYDQFELETRYGMKECRDWCAEKTNEK
jgi:hypothetical protein